MTDVQTARSEEPGLERLLSRLQLSDLRPALGSASLQDLYDMAPEHLERFLETLDIPRSPRLRLQAAIRDLHTDQRRVDMAELPPEWRTAMDERSGRRYYWNVVTRRVTWQRPPYIYPPRSLSFDEFNVLSTIGTGTYGRVRLAQDKSGRVVALKILSKSDLVRRRQVSHVKNEKMVLEKVDSPFIVKLLGTFQSPGSIVLVLEYVAGGELFSLLRRKIRFTNDVSVFYAAQIVLAFEHLHSLRIAYRDLKPENLLIDSDGFLKLADFGFAKEIKDEERAYTLCGTPEYLAPEIIQNRGHTQACDWWSLGILIHEMLIGAPPFEDPAAYALFNKIIVGKIEFTKNITDAAKDLIMKLLEPKPSYRLGNLSGGVQDIKNHPWFSNLNWDDLMNKKLKPPCIPKIRDDLDRSNFREYEEEDISTGDAVDNEIFSEFG